MTKAKKTNKTKSTKSKSKKNKKLENQQFLIKKEEQYFLISENFAHNMIPEEIYRTTLVTQIEQKKKLLQNAYQKVLNLPNEDNMDFPEAFEESLSKFEEMYPSIRENILTGIKN